MNEMSIQSSKPLMTAAWAGSMRQQIALWRRRLPYPFGGVRPAIKLIRDEIDRGAGYFFQSDIKAFFTKIPTSGIIEFIRQETRDERLSELFAKGLEVHLENKDELLTYALLFPSGGIGVAQGSSLSAFAGNVLLYEFDHELNQMPVAAVRYIDDLMIVARQEEALEAAIAFSRSRLGEYGFIFTSHYPVLTRQPVADVRMPSIF